MANKKLFKTIGAIATGALVFATAACTDTWDNHYNDQESAASQNLWEQICNDPSLSIFANFAKKAKFYRDDVHPVLNYTFADILQSGQVMTVWAPQNDAFSAEDIEYWENMCENDGYNFQVQFMSNHISLWRYNVSYPQKDTLFMYNGKQMVFDKTGSVPTMYDVELSKKNIAASNGTLHVIKGLLPFHYNFYEYIKFSGEVNAIREYVVSKDTTYFSESASIEGMPDKDGNPTYVDSVYRTSNKLFGSTANNSTSTSEKRLMSVLGFNANLPYEGGKFIMAIPSNDTWEQTIERLKPNYIYAASYIDRDKSSAKENVLRSSENPDSLTDISIKMDITSPLVYNVENQGKIGGKGGAPWTLKNFVNEFVDRDEEIDYYYNTRGDTLRSTEEWNKTNLFNGEMKEMSNGYAFITNKWDFPREFYRPDVEIKTGAWQFSFYSDNFKGSVSYQTFTNSQLPDIVDRYGRVSKDHFYIMKPDGSAKPEGDLILKGNHELAYRKNATVMSGKYDVYMVLVPYWYKEMWDKQNDSLFLDSAYVDSVASKNMNKIKVKITYDNGTKNGAKTKDFNIDKWEARKVDTVLVIPDMEFPCSYRNLEHSYPLMTITSDASAADVKKGFVRELCIDRVILKSKEDEVVLDVPTE